MVTMEEIIRVSNRGYVYSYINCLLIRVALLDVSLDDVAQTLLNIMDSSVVLSAIESVPLAIDCIRYCIPIRCANKLLIIDST